MYYEKRKVAIVVENNGLDVMSEGLFFETLASLPQSLHCRHYICDVSLSLAHSTTSLEGQVESRSGKKKGEKMYV